VFQYANRFEEILKALMLELADFMGKEEFIMCIKDVECLGTIMHYCIENLGYELLNAISDLIGIRLIDVFGVGK